jgi:hypothetical protein
VANITEEGAQRQTLQAMKCNTFVSRSRRRQIGAENALQRWGASPDPADRCSFAMRVLLEQKVICINGLRYISGVRSKDLDEFFSPDCFQGLLFVQHRCAATQARRS